MTMSTDIFHYSVDSDGIATLAFDCRRSAFFEKELVAALQIIDRGDMSAGELRGGWAAIPKWRSYPTRKNP